MKDLGIGISGKDVKNIEMRKSQATEYCLARQIELCI